MGPRFGMRTTHKQSCSLPGPCTWWEGQWPEHFHPEPWGRPVEAKKSSISSLSMWNWSAQERKSPACLPGDPFPFQPAGLKCTHVRGWGWGLLPRPPGMTGLCAPAQSQ